MVLIDMQQGKSIFNSGVNKTDGQGNLLTPNEVSRNEGMSEQEATSIRSR